MLISNCKCKTWLLHLIADLVKYVKKIILMLTRVSRIEPDGKNCLKLKFNIKNFW